MEQKKTKPVVLIVDDEKEQRSLILNFLKLRYDCTFEEAEDGNGAVDFVKSNPCDLMLLDIRMPKKGGMDVIKEAKEIKPDMDIIIVSGYISDDVVGEAMELGATDFVVKPIDLKHLMMKFETILEKRGQKVSRI